MKTKDISLIAMMAAVISICSWISIPITVPFTLQTFGIFITLLILGGRRGTIAITLYILLGIIGVPVFAGFQGGIGHILGPTGGYIVGFIFMGAVYLIGENYVSGKRKIFLLAIGLILCYLIGTLWFMTVSAKEATFWSVVLICVVPYIVPDIIKLLLAMVISDRIKNALRVQ